MPTGLTNTFFDLFDRQKSVSNPHYTGAKLSSCDNALSYIGWLKAKCRCNLGNWDSMEKISKLENNYGTSTSNKCTCSNRLSFLGIFFSFFYPLLTVSSQ